MRQTVLSVDRSDLAEYVDCQIRNLLPMKSGNENDLRLIELHLEESLIRVQRCIDEVSMWRTGVFDVLHSTQYCIFLYYLANTIWRHEEHSDTCTRLFLVNKALSAIDLFYEIQMPEVFFIGHTAGIVLAKAQYDNFLVLYQNSTVGKNHGDAPTIEAGCIMYPNTAIIGECLVRRNTTVAQGVSVINQDTQVGRIAFQGNNGELIFREPKHIIQRDFFRSI